MKYTSSLVLASVTLVTQVVYGNIITYDCSQIPNICMNFCWAVYCQGLMTPLHGGANVNADQNRKDVGTDSGSKKAANEGWSFNTAAPVGSQARAATSPDEYPLASSNEGGVAALNNQNIGPSFRMATTGVGPQNQQGEQNSESCPLSSPYSTNPLSYVFNI